MCTIVDEPKKTKIIIELPDGEQFGISGWPVIPHEGEDVLYHSVRYLVQCVDHQFDKNQIIIYMQT